MLKNPCPRSQIHPSLLHCGLWPPSVKEGDLEGGALDLAMITSDCSAHVLKQKALELRPRRWGAGRLRGALRRADPGPLLA